jgi:hypothetical protein
VSWGGAGVLPNVIFEERLNGKFLEIAVEFNFEGGRENLANPTNFSGNFPDSSDFTRFRKFYAKYPKKKTCKSLFPKNLTI